MCFSGPMPIPIIADQVGPINRYFEPIYVSGVKMNAKINNNKSSDKKTFFNALNMFLILKTVNNINISVGFNLQYSANEGIKH